MLLLTFSSITNLKFKRNKSVNTLPDGQQLVGCNNRLVLVVDLMEIVVEFEKAEMAM